MDILISINLPNEHNIMISDCIIQNDSKSKYPSRCSVLDSGSLQYEFWCVGIATMYMHFKLIPYRPNA